MTHFDEQAKRREQMAANLKTLQDAIQPHSKPGYPISGEIHELYADHAVEYRFPGLVIRLADELVTLRILNTYMFDREWAEHELLPYAAAVLKATADTDPDRAPWAPCHFSATEEAMLQSIKALKEMRETWKQVLDEELPKSNTNACVFAAQAALMNLDALLSAQVNYALAKGIFRPRKLILHESVRDYGFAPCMTVLSTVTENINDPEVEIELVLSDLRVRRFVVGFLKVNALNWNEFFNA